MAIVAISRAYSQNSPCTPRVVLSPPPVITYAGDRGPATSAVFNGIGGIARDASGNVFIADSGNNRIRVVKPDGNVTTFAGTGVAGYAGDGGSALAAQFNHPSYLAFGPDGTLYIVDGRESTSATYSTLIRSITPDGIVHTVAGMGVAGFSGDGGLGTKARIGPTAVDIDKNGVIYIADAYSGRVRRIDTNGIISSVAAAAGPVFFLDGPLDIKVAPDGSIYTAGSALVQEITKDGILDTLVGMINTDDPSGPYDGALAGFVKLSFPTLGINSSGQLLINQSSIFRYDGGYLRLVGVADRSEFVLLPDGTTLSFDSSQVYHFYPATNVRGYDYTVVAGTPPAAPAQTFLSLAADTSGTVYVLDASPTAHRINRLDTSGNLVPIVTIPTPYSPDRLPQSTVAKTPTGELLFINGASVVKQMIDGTLVSVAGSGKGSGFIPSCTTNCIGMYATKIDMTPLSIATDNAGNLFIADMAAIWRVSPSGRISGVINQRDAPVASDPHGNVYYEYTSTVAQYVHVDYIHVARINADLSTTEIASMPSRQFFIPFTVDANGHVYFAITNIARRAADGSLTTVAPQATQKTLVFDASGNLYFGPDSNGNIDVVPNAATCEGITYYQPLRYRGVQPCRLVDTRDPNRGAFGTPSLSAGQVRTFHVSDVAACAIPPMAQAYVLNATVVAPGQLSYLTLFPGGTLQPYVSTLNAPLGGIVANSAIVPAGPTGDISVYSTNVADLVLDINGYFQVGESGESSGFVATEPCRVIDTRQPDGDFGGPDFNSVQPQRTFSFVKSPCMQNSGSPDAYVVNVTLVPEEPVGYLSLWEDGIQRPLVSTLNSTDARIVANGAVVPFDSHSSGFGNVDIFSTNRTHVIVDVNGSFTPYSPNRYYPVTPCRIADTRNPNGPLGGPAIPGGTSRDFPVNSSTCNIPSTAQAYALNVTVVPHQSLGYLTIWPTGQTQPFVSTLNSIDGRIVANGAIIPAGRNGAVSVYATGTTDVVLDINGYFAP